MGNRRKTKKAANLPMDPLNVMHLGQEQKEAVNEDPNDIDPTPTKAQLETFSSLV